MRYLEIDTDRINNLTQFLILTGAIKAPSITYQEKIIDKNRLRDAVGLFREVSISALEKIISINPMKNIEKGISRADASMLRHTYIEIGENAIGEVMKGFQDAVGQGLCDERKSISDIVYLNMSVLAAGEDLPKKKGSEMIPGWIDVEQVYSALGRKRAKFGIVKSWDDSAVLCAVPDKGKKAFFVADENMIKKPVITYTFDPMVMLTKEKFPYQISRLNSLAGHFMSAANKDTRYMQSKNEDVQEIQAIYLSMQKLLGFVKNDIEHYSYNEDFENLLHIATYISWPLRLAKNYAEDIGSLIVKYSKIH